METGWRKTALAIALILVVGCAGGMVGSVALLSSAVQNQFTARKKIDETLSVTGSARKRIRSDLAVWNIRISGQAADLKEAFKLLKQSDDRVRVFLDASKIPPDEISLSAIHTETLYARDRKGNSTDVVTGYVLRRTITVTSPRVDALAKPSAEVTQLIQDGLHVVSEAPQYYYSKIGDLKIEMIGEATKDARARADQIALNAGCKIADVRTARVGVLQITQPESTEVSDSGIYDTSTIEKDVRSVVSLTLGLDSNR